MSAGEISYLMELNKRKAELEFKKGYLLSKGRGPADKLLFSLESELAEVSKQAAVLESRITASVEKIFYPNEREISRLGAKLAQFKPSEIYEAMENKAGEAYEVLKKRGLLVKKNYERRRDIAALITFVNSLPSKIREDIIERVEEGRIGKLDASTLKEAERIRLFKLLNRAGVGCMLEGYMLVTESKKGMEWRERMVDISGTYAWVEAEKEEEAKAFGKELAETGARIQVMNAVRAVRKFSPQEEAEFGELQKRYLELVRKRDALVSN